METLDDDRSHPLAPPRGMRDFYPEDMARRRRVFDAWRQAAQGHGFAEYDACVVESLDLLKRKAGEEIVNQIYAFTDKSGRDLALRPEMTPTLARMIAARQNALTFPIKWFTIAQCFRYERMTRGRKREHYQWNLDIVGEDSVAAEAEVVSAAAAALFGMGLTAADFQIRFNNRALLAELLARCGIEPASHPACYLALDKRGKMPDEAVAELLREGGVTGERAERVFGLLRIATLDDAITALGGEVTPGIQRLRDFAGLMNAYGLGDAIRFDVSVIRGLSYYTGIVFEAFDAGGALRAIFGGGRYDNLLAQVGGRPMSGVGLGFGDVVIGELLADRCKTVVPFAPARIAIGYMEEAQRRTALAVTKAWRADGVAVDLALHPEKAKAFFSRVGRCAFAEAAYIGPDDVTRGAVRVKDLATRQEREVALAELGAVTR
jgi:histidyl-tRNA synthetase